MFELNGKYNTAKIYSDAVEATAQAQIIQMLNQEFTAGSKIRFMPDIHAGKGCVIGTTMTIGDKVVPNIVGVDINCGIHVVVLMNRIIDREKLDNFIHQSIPSGTSVRGKAHKFVDVVDFDLRCKKYVDLGRAALSIGTLGGGNHFIEVDQDDDGRLYLLIHSGSRNVGKQVCEHYQDLAWKRLSVPEEEIREMIKIMKAQGKQSLIQDEMAKIKSKVPNIPKELAYIDGQDTKDYLNDMYLLEQFAKVNREAMAADIVNHMHWEIDYSFTTIHNYIDVHSGILRKGAVSAQAGEELIIPMNMRDGSLLCIGKGNEDWNCSAPHGAGRLMSRGKAKESLSMEKFKKDMEERGIYTTSVNRSTLDECGDAYKNMDEIIANMGDSVSIKKIIRPIYNYKHSKKDGEEDD